MPQRLPDIFADDESDWGSTSKPGLHDAIALSALRRDRLRRRSGFRRPDGPTARACHACRSCAGLCACLHRASAAIQHQLIALRDGKGFGKSIMSPSPSWGSFANLSCRKRRLGYRPRRR
jgi:hypothetical protein